MLIPYGDRGVLIDFSKHSDPLGQVLAYQSQLEQEKLPYIVDLIPAAQTLLVVFNRDPRGITLPALNNEVAKTGTGQSHTIAVTYDGADLTELADELHLHPQELITAHTEITWTAAFCRIRSGIFIPASRSRQPTCRIIRWDSAQEPTTYFDPCWFGRTGRWFFCSVPAEFTRGLAIDRSNRRADVGSQP